MGDMCKTRLQSMPFTTTLRACSEVMSELKPQLRALLHYHCGVKTLRTRQMMIDIQNLMKTHLSVNLNKVALVRNTRHLGIPSVTRAATLCLEAGAAGITVHPRPDARHIPRAGCAGLAQLLKAWPDREFNVEGNPFAQPDGLRAPSAPAGIAGAPGDLCARLGRAVHQ